MRISDWSSDVCSSDLALERSGAGRFFGRDAAGFDLHIGERGSRLSGGQRSFLVLARALVDPCHLLFLDEPTGAMDQQTEPLFIDHLEKALQPDQTLIVSTPRTAIESEPCRQSMWQ